MPSREEMISKLCSYSGIYAEYTGTCIAGFDIDVASKDGAGTACCQAGSSGVQGPIELSDGVRDFIKNGGTQESDVDDDEFQIFEQMVAQNCQTNTQYFYFFMGEDPDTIYLATDADDVQERWAEWAFEGTELTPWEDMEDDALEEWFDKLDV